MMLRRWLFAALWVVAPSAQALGLIEAYMAAREYDPQFRAAWQAREAGMEERNIARSQLLPQADFSYSYQRNWLHQEVESPTTGRTQTATNSNYPSYVGQVQLRQPLYNLEAWAGYQRGIALSEVARAEFDSAHQELMLRLYEAYSAVLLARDQLAIAEAQQTAFEEQMHANERMFQAGEGTRTDMIETRSRYDVAVAQVIEARDELGNAMRTLQSMIGPGHVSHPNQLQQLVPEFSPLDLPLQELEVWLQLGRSANAEVIARRLGVESASARLDQQKAGHYPTVDLIANYRIDESDSVSTINQRNRRSAVGVQVRIPLYSGGGVSARTRQAAAQYQQAHAELDATTNQVLVELERHYHRIRSSAHRIEALEHAVESAQLLVEATRQSVRGGVRVNLDVLNAEQQLYESRRDLAQARYDYLDAHMQLRYYAGVLTVADFEEVDRFFAVANSGAKASGSVGNTSVVFTRDAG